jgi:hypothetical protein
MAGEIELSKGGVNVVQASLRRGEERKNGRSHGRLLVSIKVHPAIENLLKDWGGGEVLTAGDFTGRNWVTSRDLTAWFLANDPGHLSYDRGAYALNLLGGPLLYSEAESGIKGGLLNLSFLRLCGISEGEGVSFDIKGIYSTEYIRDLAEKIKLATRRFYVDYLLPIDVTVMVQTQETKL